MMSLYFILFVSGVLTILLPCILPLIPVVVGVSITGRSKWQPLVTCAGMVLSFVGFTFLLQVVLSQFVVLADVIRVSTYFVILLFGVCFFTDNKTLQLLGAVLGGLFFWQWGWIAVTIAEIVGWLAIEAGTRIATRIQQFGADVQSAARGEFGAGSLVTAFIIGLTLGLIWVPCAGPALGFALTLVRDQPGLRALAALSAYGIGAAFPVLLIGYGGHYAVQSARGFARHSGTIKHVAGALLILSALGFQYGWFMQVQTWLVNNTTFGTLGTSLEERIFGTSMPTSSGSSVPSSPSVPSMNLPRLTRAPEFAGLGPWHNSQPLAMKELKGKVVLVDFWTYSCINCIRTLPYIEGYWDKYKNSPFVIVGVHTPEFIFEKSEKNVAMAIKEHGLTYPVAQDNDFRTWDAFANRYWPAKYLIDAQGYIRYTHFGEGQYEETDMAIASLLQEAGHEVQAKSMDVAPATARRDQSPEIYLGTRSWNAFVNGPASPTEGVQTYEAPESMDLHRYALVGQWQLAGDEYQVMRSDAGEIRMRFLGGEANLVLGREEGAKPIRAEVWIDGKKTKTFTVDRHDLYNLYKGAYGEHELILKFKGKGLEAYAFTFGA